MQAIQIRPAGPADLGAMLAVARQLPAWFNDQGIAEMTADFATHQALVAVSPEAGIVGFVTWAPSPHTPEPGLVELTWLGISPAMQRHGLGTRLTRALEQAVGTGTRIIQVSTLADTVDYPPYAQTRAFYRRAGFQDWRVDPDFYGPGDDRLLLRKTL